MSEVAVAPVPPPSAAPAAAPRASRTGTFSRIGRLLRVEARKVVGGRGLPTGIIAVVLVTAFTGWTHEVGAEDSAWTVVSTALGAGLWAAEIFLLVAGTTAISGETAQGTLKMILPHAYRRSDWVFAKALALAGQALVLLLAATAAAVVAGMLRGGLSDVTQTIEATFGGEGKTVTLHGADEMTDHLVSSTAIALASLVTTAWLGLVISCLFDGIVPALSTGFLLFLGFKSAGTLFGAGPDVMAKIYAWYPGEMLTRLEKLGRGLGERWNETYVPQALRLCGMVSAGSLLLSLVVFSRRDLQS